MSNKECPPDITINFGGGSLVSDSITLTAEECDAAWGKLWSAMERKYLMAKDDVEE